MLQDVELHTGADIMKPTFVFMLLQAIEFYKPVLAIKPLPENILYL
jgi:hypothetical protein